MKKRLLPLALALTLCLGLVPKAAAARVPFTDVEEGTWYYSDVAAAYETGLFTGTSDTTFDPEGTLSIAQAVVLAARVHQYIREGAVTLSGGTGAWYQVYVDYAKAKGIISNDYDGRWDDEATRGDMVQIFYGALPADQRKAINEVEDNAIPDVKLSYKCGEAVYAFYRAGILTGSDSTYKNVLNGTNYFKPRDTIHRCEVAAILNRMLDPGQRQKVSLSLPEIPAYDAPVTEENVLALLDNFDPDGAAIIRNADTYMNSSTYNGVEVDIHNFMAHMYDPENPDLVHRVGKKLRDTVHESFHEFNRSCTEFYLGDGEWITLSKTGTFRTEEMSKLLPEDLRTYRYKAYVSEGNSARANRSGIYGLLDEFSAYYWGNHNQAALYDYYRGYYGDWESLETENILDAQQAYDTNNNNYVSYAEFRFYILSYMLYAKENYPEIYQDILNNDGFRLVFSTIDAKFAAVVQTIMSRPGFTNGPSKWGTYSVYLEEYNRLMAVMERPEYVEMAALLQP